MRRAAGTLVVLAVLGYWALELRPASLGGPAAYVRVVGTSMEPGLHTGDVVLTRRRASYGPGDVVAYRVPAGTPGAGHVVIHRIVGGDGRSGFRLLGDNRDEEDLWRPRASDVIGERRLRVPAAAHVAGRVLSPPGLGLLAAFAAFILVAGSPPGATARTPLRSPAAPRSTDASPGGSA